MGWKSVKEAYDIDHIVQVDDQGLRIGTGYISDLLCVSKDGAITVNSVVGESSPEITRIRNEMEADPQRLLRLMRAEDRFDESLTVWTYEDGRILELECEEYGWPNVTHDGRLMYENMFFDRKEQAVKAAVRNCESAVSGWKDIVAKSEESLAKERLHLANVEANLQAYRSQARA